MDAATVTFIIGIVSCVVGVAAFISALMARAKQDGILCANVASTAKGIEDIKCSLTAIGVKSDAYYTKIDKLEVRVENIEKRLNE